MGTGTPERRTIENDALVTPISQPQAAEFVTQHSQHFTEETAEGSGGARD